MRILLIVLTALAFPLAVWAEGDLPDFNAPLPSKAAILKMRYSGFNDWADKHGSGMNELSYDQVAAYYANLRFDASKAAAAQKPGLLAAVSAVRTWSAAYYDVIYAYSGGGTMYVHASRREVADIADAEADAIAAWAATPKVLVNLNSVKTCVQNGYKADPDLKNQATFTKAANEEAAALARAKAAVAKLPPGPRNILTKLMYDVSKIKWGEG